MTINVTALIYASKFVRGISLFSERAENTVTLGHSIKPPIFNVKDVSGTDRGMPKQITAVLLRKSPYAQANKR